MNFLSNLRRALPGIGTSGAKRGVRPTGRAGSPAARGRGTGSILDSALGWLGRRNRRR